MQQLATAQSGREAFRRRYAFTYPCAVERSEGASVPRSTASPVAHRKSKTHRPCCRQVATTVNIRSANRLPALLSEPKLPLRHSTAGHSTRSATLFVGSTPSTRANVHSAGHHLLFC